VSKRKATKHQKQKKRADAKAKRNRMIRNGTLSRSEREYTH